MKVGDVVRCLDTDRVGVVIDMSRESHAMYMLVAWPTCNRWVDSTEVELVLSKQ